MLDIIRPVVGQRRLVAVWIRIMLMIIIAWVTTGWTLRGRITFSSSIKTARKRGDGCGRGWYGRKRRAMVDQHPIAARGEVCLLVCFVGAIWIFRRLVRG